MSSSILPSQQQNSKLQFFRHAGRDNWGGSVHCAAWHNLAYCIWHNTYDPGISINIFNVQGGNWDPTDKKFSSVNSYRQDLLPTRKAFPKETTTCIWFIQSHKVCNGTTVLQEVQMLWPDVVASLFLVAVLLTGSKTASSENCWKLEPEHSVWLES